VLLAEGGAVGPERSAQTATERWARVELNAACGLRRDAWCPVLSVGTEEAVVVVRHKPVVVPRSCVAQIVTPSRTNGRSCRARGEARTVCPNCAERVIMNRSSEKMLCGGVPRVV
jgi:hypothetical protein